VFCFMSFRRPFLCPFFSVYGCVSCFRCSVVVLFLFVLLRVWLRIPRWACHTKELVLLCHINAMFYSPHLSCRFVGVVWLVVMLFVVDDISALPAGDG
jgi:hypothetical protein